jgi:arylsulfatase A-like enzyme
MNKTLLTLGLIVQFGMFHAQRNVVLIIADDISPDYLGFYESHVDTVDVPNIRALLKKGIRFNNAMSNPVCSPTRSGILTGRYSFRTGIGNVVGGTGGSNPLDTSEITIPKLLKIYNSNIGKANIGKWHLHLATPASNLLYPNKMGYDHFEGPFIGQLPSYTNWTKYTNGTATNVTTYATSENVNNAVSWVKTQNSKPFFLWLAFNAPHEPLHLPPASLHTYTSLSGTAGDISANPKSYFKAMIQAMDHEIGRFFDSLKTLNRYDSTDFIFIGDNGNAIKTAQISDIAKAKGTIYQYGVHVPFIVSGPSVVSPNRINDALVNTADIFATVLELFGYATWQTQIPTGKPVDSKSMLPIIKNEKPLVRSWAFTEIFKLTTDSSDGKGIRNKDYKLIRFDYGAEEFYNLSKDSLENSNLLKGMLSATDITNYNYLCTELTSLVGNTALCKTIAVPSSIQQTTNNIWSASPNPFTTSISIFPKFSQPLVEMTNVLGQVVYRGRNIESHNFISLPKGIYILKTEEVPNHILKLVKE